MPESGLADPCFFSERCQSVWREKFVVQRRSPSRFSSCWEEARSEEAPVRGRSVVSRRMRWRYRVFMRVRGSLFLGGRGYSLP